MVAVSLKKKTEDESTIFFPNPEAWKSIGEDKRDSTFNEVSIGPEREFIKGLKGVKIAIFQSDYFKSASQLLDEQLYQAPTWKDVCLFNDDFIALRSFTSDLTHKPSKPNDSEDLVLCNNMPEFSVQALRYFKMILDADLVERIEHMVKENIETREISKRLNLSEDKLSRIIERDKTNNPFSI